jgi:CspA family cold shock protein
LLFRANAPIQEKLQSHIDGFRRFAALRFLLSLLPRHRVVRRSDRVSTKKEIAMAITGSVKFFNADKGYGFIAPDNGGNDAFVHISAVERAGMVTLNQNQRVQYELEEDRRGKMAAVNLSAAD